MKLFLKIVSKSITTMCLAHSLTLLSARFGQVVVAGGRRQGHLLLRATAAGALLIAGVAVALVIGDAGPRTSLAQQVEFRVPAAARAGEIVDVKVKGGGSQDVEIPAGAKPGELMEISEETASKIASGGRQAAAQKEKKEIVEFKVPAAGGNSQKSASY